MSLSPIEYLWHILDEIGYIEAVICDIEEADFLADETLKRSFVRSIEIIGEASKKVPIDLRQRYAHIEWRAMGGMRDRLIHDYFGVDYDIVWDVAVNKVPELQREIERILEKESAG